MNQPQQSNKSHINRLVISSSFNESISISAAINITVKQDQKEVKVDPSDDSKMENLNCEGAKRLKKLENLTAELMRDFKSPINENIKRATDLLEATIKWKKVETHEIVFKRFQNLESKLQKYLKNLSDDQKLVKAASVLQQNMNEANIDQATLEKLDRLVEMTVALADKSRNLKLQDFVFGTIQEFKIRTQNFRVSRDIQAILTRITNSVRSDYFTSKTIETLTDYIDELNQLQPTLTRSEHLEAVKQLKREIEEVVEAINALATAEQVVRLDEENFVKTLHQLAELSKMLKKIAKSELVNMKYKMRAQYLNQELNNKLKVFKEKYNSSVKVSSKENKIEASFKNVEEVLRMSPKEFEKVVQSVPALKTTLAEISTSDLEKTYRDKADQLLKDVNSKWSSYKEALGKDESVGKRNETSERKAQETFDRADKLLQLAGEEFLKQKHSVPVLVKSLERITKSSLGEEFTDKGRKIAQSILKRLRDETALSEVLKLFARAMEIIQMKQEEFDENIKESESIKTKLDRILSLNLPKFHIEKAKSVLKELEERISRKNQASAEKEKQRLLGILNAINQTLTNPNGFGGKVGLRLMRNKLEQILKQVPDADAEAKAKMLLKSVETYETKIDDILKLFQEIEKKIRPIQSEDDLKDFEKLVKNVRDVNNFTQQLNDSKISHKSSELATTIQKEIEDYKMKKQVSGIANVINKMNTSLEQVDREDEAPKDSKLNAFIIMQQGPHDFRSNFGDDAAFARSLPKKEKTKAKKEDALELLKVVNGYLRVILPKMIGEIYNITREYQKVNSSKLGTGALRDRINITLKDYFRAKFGLKVIARKLRVFKFNKHERHAIKEITNANATSAELFKLESLIDDDYTHDLVKQTFKLTQDVEHANDTLKQLRTMLVFNEKLLTPSDIKQPESIKHVIVPIQRPSLNSSLSSGTTAETTRETANKAVDLVKPPAETGSK